METFVSLLGVILGALSGSITALVGYRIKRRQDGDDAAEARQKAMADGMRFLIVDRVMAMTHEAVEAGEISIRKKALIHGLVDAGHALGANGELSACAEEVDKLPVI